MDDFNTTALLPDNIESNSEWKIKNKEWVEKEQNLIKKMITKSNEQKENPDIGSYNGTPYDNFSQKSSIMVVYKNRRDKRINQQLNYFYYKNYPSDERRLLLENTYPRLNLDKLEDDPKWNWNNNSVNGATYLPTAIGGKSKKSKRTKKSKKSKRTKRTKKSKKSRKHR